MNQAAKLLEATLAEENKADATLAKFAESEVNQHAQAAGGPSSIDGSDASPPRGVPAVVSLD